MIAYLKGKVIFKNFNSAVVDVSGVGYEVTLIPELLSGANEGDSIELYIAENIREDSYSLLGFATWQQRLLFYQLISVSGVGPKAAMAIVSAHSVEQIESAIHSGEINLFAGVSGVGKKTAQRIILELKGKLVSEVTVEAKRTDSVSQALVSLGYSSAQAQQMSKNLPAELSTEDKIKLALKSGAK